MCIYRNVNFVPSHCTEVQAHSSCCGSKLQDDLEALDPGNDLYLFTFRMKYLLPSLSSFHYFADKGPYSQSSGFSCSHVWMWELDYKESWVPKNWSFWTVVLEKTLERPLDCKEIKPVNPKGNQSWIFIGRTDREAEIPILWPTNARNWLIGKYHDAGKDWRQEEKGTTEDEMVGRHHWLDEHESEQALGVGDGQEGLACCSPWVGKEMDWTNEVSILIQMHCVKK